MALAVLLFNTDTTVRQLTDLMDTEFHEKEEQQFQSLVFAVSQLSCNQPSLLKQFKLRVAIELYKHELLTELNKPKGL